MRPSERSRATLQRMHRGPAQGPGRRAPNRCGTRPLPRSSPPARPAASRSTRLLELEDEAVGLARNLRVVDFGVVVVNLVAKDVAAADEDDTGALEIGLHDLRVDAVVFLDRRPRIRVRVCNM